MRLLVCGDREWQDSTTIDYVIQQLHPTVIIEGECRGADLLARDVAECAGYSVDSGTILPFPAMWSRFGRSAGPRRNTQMLKEGKPDLVVAFHSHIEVSRGTADMLSKAEAAGVLYCLVEGDVNEKQL